MGAANSPIWSRLILAAVILALVAVYHYWPQPTPFPPEAVRQPVLAILHFEDLGGTPDTNFLTEGFTSELITKAGQLESGQLGVIAYDSVVGYEKTRKSLRQMGRELGVDYILEGGFGRDQAGVHITTSLIRISDQNQLWSGKYDRPVGELSNIQVEIIREIGDSLGLKWNPADVDALNRASTANPAAREAYLHAVGACETEIETEIAKCIALFERAIALDREYGRAYSGLAAAHIQRLEFGQVTPEADYKTAEASARKAIAVAEKLPQAHQVLGETLYRYDHDSKGAESEFQRALELNRNDSTSYLRYAGFLLDEHRPNDALTQIGHALDLDPFSTDAHMMAGRIEMAVQSYDRAIEQLEKTVSLNRDFPPGHYYLGEAYLQRGKTNDAIRELRQAVSFKPAVPEFVAALGRAYAAAGRYDEAAAQLTELKKLGRVHPLPPGLLEGLSQALKDKRQSTVAH